MAKPRGFALLRQVAESLARHRRIDAVLTDYSLGHDDGISLLRRIHSFKPGVPGLLMTAYPNPDVFQDAMERGRAEGVFVKPLDVDKLVGRLAELIARARIS